MIFEYDQQKSTENRKKHGIDFDNAQALWDDPLYVEIAARTDGEKRFLIIGNIEGKIWSAVITYRNGKIRIISVRRARIEERKLYESEGF